MFFRAKYNFMALVFKYEFEYMSAAAGSKKARSGNPIFDKFFDQQ